MAGSVFASHLYSKLFPAGDVGRLFSDTAEIRAMLLVEGALAKVQGAMGIIPEISAAAISRAAMEIQIDPGALAKATGENGVCVPGLVAHFRELLQAPEHAQYIHWGATSQDIIDSALMLRLRQALVLIENDLKTTIAQLATLAEDHAELPMAARTWGQQATVTSFGSVVAVWGHPLLDLVNELDGLRDRCLIVSLSGATGTASALGPQAGEIRTKLADALGLVDPERSWHTDRAAVLRIADWMVRVTDALAKAAEDIIALVQSEVSEVTLGGAGASSTMPQKQNPVGPSAVAALAVQNAGSLAALHQSARHRHQRDGAAWFTEWVVLPQIVMGTAAATQIAVSLTAGLKPATANMAANLQSSLDLVHAEALSFALCNVLPRPEAQAKVKSICREAIETSTSLHRLVARDFPEIDATELFDPSRQMGQAPDDARSFVRHARDFDNQSN